VLVRVGDKWSLAYCFEGLADIARARGEWERAARLFGAAEGLRQAIAAPLPPGESAPTEQARKATVAALGRHAFDVTHSEGRMLTLEQAVAYALESQPSPGSTAPRSHRATPRQMEKAKFDGLTAREREVAELITQGKSNRAIAEQLVVTERTIEKHVENILSKLGFTSRAQVAVWGVQRGLTGHSD
jgi:non-specific serine/threonine protein kinase